MKTFVGLKFKLAAPKKEKKATRISNKLYEGVCYNDNGTWKIHVPYPDISSMLSLEFTEQSYSLKRRVVFHKNRDKLGRYHMVIRLEREYLYSPGLDTQYTPFCDGFAYKGYVVKKNGKLMFDMKDIIIKNDLSYK